MGRRWEEVVFRRQGREGKIWVKSNLGEWKGGKREGRGALGSGKGIEREGERRDDERGSGRLRKRMEEEEEGKRRVGGRPEGGRKSPELREWREAPDGG